MKSKQHSVKYNFLMNFIYNVLSYAAPLITYPYVARVLSPEGIGRVTFAQSYGTYFSMFAIFGVTTFATREVAKKRENQSELNRFVSNVLLLELLLSCSVYLLYLTSIYLIPSLDTRRLELLIISVNIFTGGLTCSWLYTGLEKFDFITVRYLICKIVSIVLLFSFVKTKNDFGWYAFTLTFTDGAVNVWGFISLHNYAHFEKPSWKEIKSYLPKSVPFFSTSLANNIYLNLDSIMLTFISGNVQNGYYSVVLKVKQLLTAIVLSLARVLLPRLANEKEKNNTVVMYTIIKKSFHITAILALYFCAFSLIFSDTLITLFAGNAYKDAIYAMYWGIASVLFVAISGLLNEQVFIALGKEKQVNLFIWIGAVIDLILNSVLMPKYGAAGGAAATFITELIVLILALNEAHKMKLSLSDKSQNIKLVVLGIFAFIICISLKKIIQLNLMLKFILCGFVYTALFIGTLFLIQDSLIYDVIEAVRRKNK